MFLSVIIIHYSTLLYGFLFHFSYFNSIEAAGLTGASDFQTYQNLPVVRKMEDECESSVIVKRKDCRNTTQMIWLLRRDIKMLDHIISYPNVSDTYECLQACYARSDCEAILLAMEENENVCFIYGEKRDERAHSRYWTYTLTCCILKPTKIPNDPKINLPIVRSHVKNCESNSGDNWQNCDERVWLMRSKTDVTGEPYKVLWNKPLVYCLNECIKDKMCNAVIMTYFTEQQYHFQSSCEFEDDKNVKMRFAETKTVYELICCKIIYQSLWAYSETNLMLLVNLKPHCDSTKSPTLCKGMKAWHMEEGKRYKGHYDVVKLTTTEECLDLCLKIVDCEEMSIDYGTERCLLIRTDALFQKKQAVFSQPNWITYSTICCREFEDQNRTTDDLDYPNFRVIFNTDNECANKPVQFNVSTCNKQFVWLLREDIKLIDHNKEYETYPDETTCLKICYGRRNIANWNRTCTAILRVFDKGDCFQYYKFPSNPWNPGKYRNYFLTCCDLIVENKLSTNEKHNLPIVFNPKENCLNNIVRTVEEKPCKHFSWHMQEKKSFTNKAKLIKQILNKDIIICLNACIDIKDCRAVAYETQLFRFSSICHLYQAIDDGVAKIFHPNVTLYEIICCNVQSIVVWNHTRFDLMMVHQPATFCHVSSITEVNSCIKKIWHLEEGLKIDEPYLIILMTSIQSCLNQCSDIEECFTVSIDLIHHRCLFFTLKTILQTKRKYYNQNKWLTYTLKCCIDYEESLLSVFDYKNKTNYPIIFDHSKECLRTNNPFSSCRFLSWTFLDNTQLDGIIQKKFTTLKDCLQACSSTFKCVGVSKEKNVGDVGLCTLHKYLTNQKKNNTQFKTLYLDCCELKEKNSSENIEFYLPIVHNINVCSTNSGSDVKSCAAKSWQIIENSDLSENSFLSIANTLPSDCLVECAKLNGCLAVVWEDLEDFENICRLYKKMGNVIGGKIKKIVYKLICCDVMTVNRDTLKYIHTDHIILHQPYKVCKVMSVKNVKSGNFKIWHAEEKMRFQGHYNIIQLSTIQHCLNLCAQSLQCMGVSIDFYRRRCLFYQFEYGVEILEHTYGQLKWISYSLKYCFM